MRSPSRSPIRRCAARWSSRVPLRAKLLVCVTGVTIMPVIFAVLLAHTEATRSLRDFTIRWQNAMLDAARERLDAGADLAEPAAAGGCAAPGADRGRARRPRGAGASGIGAKLEPDIAASVEQAVARGEASGDSAAAARRPRLLLARAARPTDPARALARRAAPARLSPRSGPSSRCCWWCRRGSRRCWRGCWRRT